MELETIIEFIYLMLPGIVANMMPVLVRKIPLFDTPISVRWFGSHKTYRGFIFGILGAIIVVYIQKKLYTLFVPKALSIFPYDQYSFIIVGFLIGFGVLFGDLIKSFFKRRVGIAPGKRWFPFDQLDGLIGGWICLSIIYTISIRLIFVLALFVLILHISINHIGYYVGIRESKW